MSKEHEEALERAKLAVLQRIAGKLGSEQQLQLAQAYEALCTGAAMVRPDGE